MIDIVDASSLLACQEYSVIPAEEYRILFKYLR